MLKILYKVEDITLFNILECLSYSSNCLMLYFQLFKILVSAFQNINFRFSKILVSAFQNISFSLSKWLCRLYPEGPSI